MKERLLGSLSMLGGWVLILVVGIPSLVGGYWLSDRVYDAGLWPIGIPMRIFLLVALAGFAVAVVVIPISAIVAFFKKDWLEEP